MNDCFLLYIHTYPPFPWICSESGWCLLAQQFTAVLWTYKNKPWFHNMCRNILQYVYIYPMSQCQFECKKMVVTSRHLHFQKRVGINHSCIHIYNYDITVHNAVASWILLCFVWFVHDMIIWFGACSGCKVKTANNIIYFLVKSTSCTNQHTQYIFTSQCLDRNQQTDLSLFFCFSFCL